MSTLFLRVLNMSVTASYVILAVLAARLLLGRAPKRYSYLLWSVVLYRLLSPASFASAMSLFSLRPWQMATAQRNGAAVLSYAPANLGQAPVADLTVGIPAVNSLIRQSLPEAAAVVGPNPWQQWVALGALVWFVGVIALLVHGLVAYLRVQKRVATAVRLEGNVFETENIRSPFILGLFSPRILIPFGLSAEEQTHILRHERCHLRRRDHLIKLLSFAVLAIYWFNPLVCLAFALMSRDMEMSCDEQVLTSAGAGGVQSYGRTLLSLATRRHLPAASPLAFGETGIRQRVLNILRFRQPTRWATILATLGCLLVTVACVANPLQQRSLAANSELYGSYAFQQQVYMNPLSSFLALDGHREYYTFAEDSLIVTDAYGNQRRTIVSYEPGAVDAQAFSQSFGPIAPSFGAPDISTFKERRQCTLLDASGKAIYRVYRLDDQIWLARLHWNSREQSEYIWSIYRILAFDEDTPARATIYGNEDGVADFLSLQTDFQSGYDQDDCHNITPEHIQTNSGYRVFKYAASCASFLLYQGEVYPLGGWMGGLGVTSMSLADLNQDGEQELCFTFSFGSGLHRSHVGFFDPAAKQVVVLDYVHPNTDMMLAYDNQGILCLYEASGIEMDSFVDFSLEKGGLLAEIGYEDGQVSLQMASDR